MAISKGTTNGIEERSKHRTDGRSVAVVDHQPHGDKQLADAERLCA